MKKLFTFAFILFLLPIGLKTVVAQSPAAPNGDFELWNGSSFNFLTNYRNNSVLEDPDLFVQNNIPYNVSRVNGYHGNFALKLTTVGFNSKNYFAYVVNGQPQNDNITAWHGGIPYTEQPTGVKGFYKYNLVSGDYGVMVVAFSKNGVNIGSYYIPLSGEQTSFTEFNYTLTPALTASPDSVMIAFTSSDISATPVEGSTLIIDSVAFTGVIAQPAKMDGDFEDWTTTELYRPQSWYSSRGGIGRSNTSYEGNYALRLVTYEGEDKGVAVARPAQASTGYYPQNCNNNCQQIGGYPYTRPKDGLGFWYIYTPSGNDKASVSVRLKKESVTIYHQNLQLDAAASYQYGQLNWDLGTNTPDSVIIDFQSSDYQNSALSFVGSTLWVDKVHFIADLPTSNQLTGSERIKMEFENPILYIYDAGDGATIKIYSLTGTVCYSKSIDNTTRLSLETLNSGIYIAEVQQFNGKKHQIKLIKQ